MLFDFVYKKEELHVELGFLSYCLTFFSVFYKNSTLEKISLLTIT